MEFLLKRSDCKSLKYCIHYQARCESTIKTSDFREDGGEGKKKVIYQQRVGLYSKKL